MKQSIFTVIENRNLTKDVCLMKLQGDTDDITRPGQFVNIALDGFYLRRPISVCDWEKGELTIIYKVVGRGTTYMSCLEHGAKLDVLTGLGNGYDTNITGDRPLIIGGGVGVPPMYGLGKELVRQGKHPVAILGFNKREEIFFEDEFRSLGIETIITTADGSAGVKGFVTDAMVSNEQCQTQDYTYVYACGPEPMLRAVWEKSNTSGQFSFEERMGCGFGACMGCSCKTKYGNKRICKDGPVLVKEEIIW